MKFFLLFLFFLICPLLPAQSFSSAKSAAIALPKNISQTFSKMFAFVDANFPNNSTTSQLEDQFDDLLQPGSLSLNEDENFYFPNYLPEFDVNTRRFWTTYQIQNKNIKTWWESDYATLNWFGLRDKLFDHGINVGLNYLSNFAGNVTGGKSRGFSYADNYTLSVELDSQRILNYPGGTLRVIVLDRNGRSISAENIGNLFAVQQVYGGSRPIFYGLAYNQSFFNNKFSIKFGRIGAGEDFATSPFYWLYMSNGIDGRPKAIGTDSRFSSYPWAVWGTRIRGLVTKETEAIFGVYQVAPRVTNPYSSGLDWRIRGDDGIMLIGQYGISHEFFKSNNDSYHKNNGVPSGYPGHYWFGGYYSSYSYPQFNSKNSSHECGFYWHGDQLIFKPDCYTNKGLSVWTSIVYAPQQNISKLPFQSNFGLVYTGLLANRPQDLSIFGIAYGSISYLYTDPSYPNKSTNARYELVYEFAYRTNISKSVYIQPDIQWVVNPSGNGNIPNALVLGAQIGVTF